MVTRGRYSPKGITDISSGTNLSATSPIVLTGDDLSINNAAADGSTKGATAFTATDFNASSGIISLDYTNAQAAATGVKGFLTGTDWDTFNGKSDLALGETSTTAYRGDRGKTAYDHSQVAGGDSVHVSTTENTNWDTAFGWGDHASGGYLKADGSVALAGAWDMGSQNLTNVNIDSGTVDGVALGATCTQAEWDAANTHIGESGASHTYIDQAVTTTGTPSFDTLTLTNATQDYLFTGRNQYLGLQSQTSAQNFELGLHTKDGDGTDFLKLLLFGKGTPDDVSVFEYFGFGYQKTYWDVRSTAGGGGSILPIYIYTGTRTTQLRLATNGNITMGYNLQCNNLDVTNLIECDQITYDSTDPQLETFYPVTKERALDLLRYSAPPDKRGGSSIYFNKDRKQLELYQDGKIYKFVLEEVETVGEIKSEAYYEDKFKFDKTSGDVVPNQRPQPRYKLKDNFEFDKDTGKFYEMVEQDGAMVRSDEVDRLQAIELRTKEK